MTSKPVWHRTGLVLVTALAAQTFAAEKLPTDDRIKTGTLPNGVTWMFRHHDNPPGKMAMLIHVRTGSLNETEEQRGLAHFLEHMAFNGSENFKPGELIPYFESIGLEFGADLNGFTTFDQTVYLLILPDTKVETVERGLTVLSDYAFRQSLIEDEINKERDVVIAEKRSGLNAQQRVRDQLFETLFAGMRLGQRLPIGIEKVLKEAPKAEFEKYYRTWYRPERVTVMLVGDGELEQYKAAIEKQFGQYKPTTEAKPDLGPDFKPFTKERAIVITDAEYTTGDVDLYNIMPGRPPTTTVEQARVDLIEQIASWIIDRRFAERVKKGEATYRRANATVFNFFNEAMMVNASAVGEPKDWEKLLGELVAEVNRAREYGFLSEELELAKTELLSGAERAVRTEPTIESRDLLMEISTSVNDREPVLSAQQHLDLLKKLLPTVQLAEVTESFKQNYKPGTFAYVLTLPQKDDVKRPTEDEVLAAAKAANARKVDPPKWEARPTTILENEPTPGKVVDTQTDADLNITNLWLDNGARVHHRFMDYKKDTILISITLAGGEIEETTENAGVSTVASLVFSQPATNRLRSTDVQDIMTGKNISVGGGAQGDAFVVTVTGSPLDLEPGLQLAYALLTEGKLEQTAFDTWKQQALQEYAMYSKFPQFVAIESLLHLTSGNDPRRTMMTDKKIEAQSLERSQAWYTRLCREAPIEVAVVGEMKLDQVMPLIEKYVGALPKRERLGTQLDKLRKFNRKTGPLEERVTVDTVTPQAMVLAGFMGCEIREGTDVRAMTLAAHTLDSRLIKRIREELALVYSINANNVPAETYDDSGIFVSGAPCAPDKADETVKEIETLFIAFAQSGPTAEELDNAKKQTANRLDTDLKEPGYWFRQLQHLDLHKLKLDDMKNLNEKYQALTAEQVQKTFAKFFTPARSFRIVAKPGSAAIEEGKDAEKTPAAPAAKP